MKERVVCTIAIENVKGIRALDRVRLYLRDQLRDRPWDSALKEATKDMALVVRSLVVREGDE